MNPSKIHFSAEEIELVRNQDWLLTKNRIIAKVYGLMGELSSRLQEDLVAVSFELTEIGPKISRGENYKGLPYVMFDFPRYFKKEDTCAIRTFFWWGNYISVTLHLKGIYKDRIMESLIDKRNILADNDFRLCISGDEWEHDLNNGQYQSITSLNDLVSVDSLRGAPFVKVSAAIMLEQWDQIQDKIYSRQQLLYQLVMDQFPRR